MYVDPREVLAILNEKGYRNISAQQLKEFIQDLKKLIKYEERYGPPPTELTGIINSKENKKTTLFDKLYSATTIASRAKLAKPRAGSPVPGTNCRIQSSTNSAADSPVTSTPKKSSTPRFSNEFSIIERSSEQDKPKREARRKLIMDNIAGGSKEPKKQQPTTTNDGVTKMPKDMKSDHKSGSSIRVSLAERRFIRNTPTDLYQYYQDNWERFKNNVPGENNHTVLRQAIRKRMESIQKVQKQPKVMVCLQPEHRKQIKRIN